MRGIRSGQALRKTSGSTPAWRLWQRLSLGLSFQEPPRDVSRDLEGLRDRPALGDQALHVVRGREVDALRELLDVYGDEAFQGRSPAAILSGDPGSFGVWSTFYSLRGRSESAREEIFPRRFDSWSVISAL